MKLDKKDLRLIEYIQENGRASIRKIAKDLGLKPTSVFTRLKKLEKEGIIEKYSAVISREKLGYNVVGFVLITYKKSHLSQEELALKLKKFNQILEVHIIAGEWDLLVKIVEKDIKSLGEFITNKLRNIPEIEKTETLIVLKTVKESNNLSVFEE